MGGSGKEKDGGGKYLSPVAGAGSGTVPLRFLRGRGGRRTVPVTKPGAGARFSLFAHEELFLPYIGLFENGKKGAGS
jgi:hypothetical protein